ncbi:hypothetical protein ACJX0J_015767 [Zea mays]
MKNSEKDDENKILKLCLKKIMDLQGIHNRMGFITNKKLECIGSHEVTQKIGIVGECALMYHPGLIHVWSPDALEHIWSMLHVERDLNHVILIALFGLELVLLFFDHLLCFKLSDDGGYQGLAAVNIQCCT